MELRERVIGVALKHFARNGVRSVTMDDIARENGMSKRTLYEMFKDKEDLLWHCMDLFDVEKDRVCRQVKEESVDTIEVFFWFLRMGLESLKELNPLFRSEMKKFHPRVWQEFDQRIRTKDLEFNIELLKRGIDEGLFRNDLKLDIVTRILMAQIELLDDEDLFPSREFSRSEVFESVMINYIRGLSTEKGMSIIDSRLSEKYSI